MTTSEARAMLLAAAVLLAPGAAFAQGDHDPRAPFEEGRALIRAGRYAEALKKFEESAAIRPTPGALLNMGDCYVKLGRYASATTAFGTAARLAEESKQQERAAEARERLSAVKPLVSTLAVHVEPVVDGVRLTVDGKEQTPERAFEIDGGDHVVHASAPCHLDIELRVVVGLRSDARAATATMPADPACLAPPRTEKPRAEAPRAEPPPFPVVPVVLGAVGVVALGVGAGFGLDAAGKKSDLESACTSYPRGCPIARRDELDATASAADRSALISTIAIGAGAALLVTGAVLYFTGGRAKPSTASIGTFTF